jgi:hypothetical protein
MASYPTLKVATITGDFFLNEIKVYLEEFMQSHPMLINSCFVSFIYLYK